MILVSPVDNDLKYWMLTSVFMIRGVVLMIKPDRSHSGPDRDNVALEKHWSAFGKGHY
jgi:hypothetical protein